MSKIDLVTKRDGQVVPFRQERITNAIYRAAVAVGGRDKQIAQQLSDQVVSILEERYTEKIPGVEEIQDIVEKVLIENGHARVAKAYILYRDERNRRRNRENSTLGMDKENIPWAKLWSVLDWAVDHHVNTVELLNERIRSGQITDLIMESETEYAQDISAVENSIHQNRADIKLVVFAGPSSSGKTTTTRKVALRLKEKGFSLVELNLDNYYFDVVIHPKDEFGDYDFETPRALDIELINTHLKDLLDGREIHMPTYDFKTGKRIERTTPVKLEKNDVILIDSLYGLYPPLTEGVKCTSYKVYIEPLLQLKGNDGEYVRWTDIRLMRRMLRDAVDRGYQYGQTLTHWHYVRSGELGNILPYLSSANYVINSGMPYELPIYRPKLIESFKSWSDEYEQDPLRQDAYRRAFRIYRLLKSIDPLENDSVVPADSVIREFIGGLSL